MGGYDGGRGWVWWVGGSVDGGGRLGWRVWRLRSLMGRGLRRGFGRRWRSRRSGCWSMGCCRSWGCCWWGMIRRRRRMCGVRSGLGRRRGLGCGSCALRWRGLVGVEQLQGVDQVRRERLGGMAEVRVEQLRGMDQVGVERLRGVGQVRVERLREMARVGAGQLRVRDQVRVERRRRMDQVGARQLRGRGQVGVGRRGWRRGLGRRLMR